MALKIIGSDFTPALKNEVSSPKTLHFKGDQMKKVNLLCVIMVVFLLSTLFLTLAQQTNDAAQAIIDAKNDIYEPYGWLASSFLVSLAFGCLGGSVVILSSQMIKPSPPTHRFLGKSSEYVSLYTKTYQSKMKSKRILYTFGGCFGGSIVAAFLWKDLYTQ